MEGKLDGLPLNRGLFDEDGKLYDIIAGTFLVAGLAEDSFDSLTSAQIADYSEVYRQPQMFVRLGDEFVAIPVEPEQPEETPERESSAPQKDGKKPSVMERLQEKKKEAAELDAARPKTVARDKARGMEMS